MVSAEAIKAKYGKAEGDVALITSIPGVGSFDQRAKGFKEEIAAKYPGLKLVADKVADGMATTGLNIMTDLITANPNLRGVFASNLIMAQGGGQAIAENKAADKIELVAFDSDDKLIGFLKDGTIKRLVVQDPYRMGYEGVKTALAASKGEKVPATVDTGVNLITKENMDQCSSAGTVVPQGEVGPGTTSNPPRNMTDLPSTDQDAFRGDGQQEQARRIPPRLFSPLNDSTSILALRMR